MKTRQDFIKERVAHILSNIFHVSEASITDVSSQKTIAAWDSFGHLTLIVALEEEFAVTFASNEIINMSSVKDIVQVLSRHKIKESK